MRANGILLVVLLIAICGRASGFSTGAYRITADVQKGRRHAVSLLRKRRHWWMHMCPDDASAYCDSSCRRRALHCLGVASRVLLDTVIPPQPAYALFGSDKDRRQLEFCLVQVMRVMYWAESVSIDIRTAESEERRKILYLEARLGAKAILTERIGGGATFRVYNLASLQLRGCLEDLVYYASKPSKRQVSDYVQDLIEALAAVVEFDGLETTTDPSPRSSLTLGMYSATKLAYVQRLLSERVLLTGKSLINCFDPGVRERCRSYVASNYPNEVPQSSKAIAPAS